MSRDYWLSLTKPERVLESFGEVFLWLMRAALAAVVVVFAWLTVCVFITR